MKSPLTSTEPNDLIEVVFRRRNGAEVSLGEFRPIIANKVHRPLFTVTHGVDDAGRDVPSWEDVFERL